MTQIRKMKSFPDYPPTSARCFQVESWSTDSTDSTDDTDFQMAGDHEGEAISRLLRMGQPVFRAAASRRWCGRAAALKTRTTKSRGPGKAGAAHAPCQERSSLLRLCSHHSICANRCNLWIHGPFAFSESSDFRLRFEDNQTSFSSASSAASFSLLSLHGPGTGPWMNPPTA